MGWGLMPKLTAIEVRRLKEPGYYSDGNGLYLQVQKGGAKSWIFRYSRQGKRREMGLGKYESGLGGGRTLAQARDAAADNQNLLRDGLDPIEERGRRRAESAAEAALPDRTFDAIFEEYVVLHAPAWKHKDQAEQWRRAHRQYVKPVIGHLDVAEVVTDHLVQILKPIWLTKPDLSGRIRGRIEVVLDYCKVQDWRSGDNPARYRGHLSHRLPKKQKKTLRVVHHPALPWKEVPDLFAKLAAIDESKARLLELTILTAARPAEAREVPKQEIDREKASWTVDKKRMKTHREHRIPLSKAALNTIERAWKTKPSSKLLFESPKTEKAFSAPLLPDLLVKLGYGHVTVHGFRSSFRDWSSEATKHPREIAEAALSHVRGDETEAAYARSDLFEKRRKLMEDWGKFCMSKVR